LRISRMTGLKEVKLDGYDEENCVRQAEIYL